MRRVVLSSGLVLLLGLAAPAGAEEPSKPKAAAKAKASAPGASQPKSTRSGTPAATVEAEGKPASGARETVALEIVAKAPKPIPPVELDMLQLRLMLTDLKASFADEIDKALFREPF
jgi:hypothetical protein